MALPALTFGHCAEIPINRHTDNWARFRRPGPTKRKNDKPINGQSPGGLRRSADKLINGHGPACAEKPINR